jgi:hypothetical protein
LITLFFAVIDLGLSRALELFFNRPVNDQIYNTNTIDPGIPVSDNVSEMGTAPENTTGETTEQNTEQTPSESPDAGANEPDTSPAPPSE